MKKEYLFAIGAVIFWGTMATAAKLLTENTDSMTVLFWTCLFATLTLTIYNAVTGKLKLLFKLSLRTILLMVLIGSLGIFFYNWFFYLGANKLPAQQAMVINDLWPALIIVFSCIILKEKMTPAKAAAVLLSFIGIIVVVANGNFSSFLTVDVFGVLCCLAAAVCYALYSVLNKKMTYDKGLAVLIAYASATLICLVILLIGGNFAFISLKEVPGYLYNGAVVNAAAYLLWVFALEKGNTAVIANLAYLAPFVSLLVTHFVLGEPIEICSVLGLVLIVSGILLQLFAAREKTAKNAN